MASRFPGFRRFSSASQPPQPQSPGLSDDGFDRPTTAVRPASTSGRSFSTVSNIASSIGNRGSARSFATQSPIASADPAHYSNQGIREETAQLASFAFSDPDTIHDTTPKRERTASLPVNAGLDYSKKDLQEERPDFNTLYSGSYVRPPAIQEVSEPASPITTHPATPTVKPKRSNISEISKLFSTSQSPPKDESQETEEERAASRGKDSMHLDVPELVIEEAEEGEQADENTPLIMSKGVDHQAISKPDAGGPGDLEGQPVRRRRGRLQEIQEFAKTAQHKGLSAAYTISHPKSWDGRAIWEKGIKEPVGLLPCVFLGVLLNVLDALSYGMILFPLGEPVFEKTGPDGISMFYVSCIVSQLIFSSGGSIFKGAVGSEMIEVVPFFHKMTYTIMARIGHKDPKVIMATVITSYAMSSVITGLVFLILGLFKLGSLVNFFPRHILIGCIGGVGFFLFVTGIEVSARLDGNLEYDMATLHKLFQADTIALWIVPLVLSVVLLSAKRFTQSPYLVPAFFVIIAATFYIVVAAVPALTVEKVRNAGWIFSAVESGVPFYHFYSYYDFHAVDWNALARTIPAMFALTFFGILHVPINIPALAIAAQEDDLNLNRELIAHGFTNAISGFVGSIQNYLVYVNSEMFISNGGNNRLAGLLLAAATFGVWVAGPAMIGYVPIMVVGALIFYLGIALLEEALYDTWGKMNNLEYGTVLAIVLIMGVYDFVAGILAGIVLACLNFVVQTSRKSAIRATYPGSIIESTVRRHPIQRHFLHEVGNQIFVTKLAGFLFFGSIVQVEKQSRALIEDEAFKATPIRFLVFDLIHVNGIDYSAAEAFTRMERILGRRGVRMIVSGVSQDSETGRSLQNVGLWSEDSSVEFFEVLNDALEYCENELLKALYRKREALSQNPEHDQNNETASLDVPKSSSSTPNLSSYNPFSPSTASPRQHLLDRAATSTLSTTTTSNNQSHTHPSSHLHLPPNTQSSTQTQKKSNLKQPLPLLMQTFHSHAPHLTLDFWHRAAKHFKRQQLPAGHILYRANDEPNAFYIVEEGMLRAAYDLPVGRYEERIVAGTTCGELPFFSETKRTATVWAEGSGGGGGVGAGVGKEGEGEGAVVWRLGRKEWEEMENEWGEGARELLGVALKLTKERMDAVVGYVLSTAG